MLITLPGKPGDNFFFNFAILIFALFANGNATHSFQHSIGYLSNHGINKINK